MYTCILLICCTICTTSAEKTFIQLGRQFSWFSIQNLVCLFLNFQNSSIHVSSFLLSTLVTTKCMCLAPLVSGGCCILPVVMAPAHDSALVLAHITAGCYGLFIPTTGTLLYLLECWTNLA